MSGEKGRSVRVEVRGDRNQNLQGLNWHLVLDVIRRKGFVMFNFRYQLDQTTGSPGIGQILF